VANASRNNDADSGDNHASNTRGWDFAIPLRRGLHITVFPPPWWLVVCAAIVLMAIAIVATIRVF